MKRQEEMAIPPVRPMPQLLILFERFQSKKEKKKREKRKRKREKKLKRFKNWECWENSSNFKGSFISKLIWIETFIIIIIINGLTKGSKKRKKGEREREERENKTLISSKKGEREEFPWFGKFLGVVIHYLTNYIYLFQ